MKFLLVYDGDCGPCARFKRAIEFLDVYGKLDYMSLIDADDKDILDKLSQGLRHRSFHLVSPDGGFLSGAGALPSLIGLLPTGRTISTFITLAPGGLASVSFVYSVFSRLHDSGSCRYKNEARATRSGRQNSRWHHVEISLRRKGIDRV